MGAAPSDLSPGQTRGESERQASGRSAPDGATARPSVVASEAAQSPETPGGGRAAETNIGAGLPTGASASIAPVRRLLSRLRDLHAHGAAPVSELVRLVASAMA